MPTEAPLVILVEDDPEIRRQMSAVLARWQLRVDALEDFSAVSAEVVRRSPALAILDINLPCSDGFSVCAEIRRHSRIPILMVSARGSSMDTVMALAQGADDYLVKPFDPEVLVAKVQALLRRSYQYSSTVSENLRCGDLVLARQDATLRLGDRAIALTRNEFLLAQALMLRPGQLVSRDELMQALWQDQIFVDDNTLSVNVSRLRKKLETLSGRSPIETCKGQGYRFVVDA